MSMMLNILTKSKIKLPLNHNHVCTCNSHSDNTPPHCRHNSISDPSCNEHIYYIGHSESESLGGGGRKETRKKYDSTIPCTWGELSTA